MEGAWGEAFSGEAQFTPKTGQVCTFIAHTVYLINLGNITH